MRLPRWRALAACSPDERSEIRDGVRVVPDLAALIRATTSDTTSRSRGAMRPSCESNHFALDKEGAGKTGCALHPRSRVQWHKKVRTRAYRSSGEHPAFPAQWFDGLWRALPGDEFLLPPSLPD